MDTISSDDYGLIGGVHVPCSLDSFYVMILVNSDLICIFLSIKPHSLLYAVTKYEKSCVLLNAHYTQASVPSGNHIRSK